jgi:very-short-patch-repair endonuclease
MQQPANRPTSAVEILRAKQLFRFLKAFAERRMPVALTLSQHPWTLPLRQLPSHPSIAHGEVILSPAQGPEETPDASSALLRVERPTLTHAPPAPEAVRPFLMPGWESATGMIRVLRARNIVRGGENATEDFEADHSRVAAFQQWRVRWERWAQAERPAVAAMRVFERLYELRGRIDRESEQVELILGDGRLRWHRQGGRIDHPILLQRIELHFDSRSPAFEIVDAERGPELYTPLLAADTALSPVQLRELQTELEQGGYHPLASTATSGFLRRVAQLLGPRGTFRNDPGDARIGEDPIIVRDPVIFLRTRPSGYAAAFDRVLQDLDNRTVLPPSLTRLVGVEPPLPPETTEDTHSPWGEPPDVLLSKPANAEQVQIARALNRHRAIVVQGPPGTGKSHTIANLIGHLVAHGKRVLVTSHTTKALRVLRDQIVETLQPLCVAVLDSDSESRAQMEESVRGILSRLTASNEEQLKREASDLAEQRSTLNTEILSITENLRTAREAEYQSIIVAGEAIEPAVAAREVCERNPGNDWIPGPLDPGAPLPLSESDLEELYASNAQLNPDEDAEISAQLPDPNLIPSVDEFRWWTEARGASQRPDLVPFWDHPATEEDLPRLEHVDSLIRVAAGDLAREQAWQRVLIAAGHSGGSERELWMDLARAVESAQATWSSTRRALLENDVVIDQNIDPEEVRSVIGDASTRVNSGGSIGGWTLLWRPSWKRVLGGCRVSGQPPSSPAHFLAIADYLKLKDSRDSLRRRWSRQAHAVGMPPFEGLGDPPEPVAGEFALQFKSLLAWWSEHWEPIHDGLRDVGFRWHEFRNQEVARGAPRSPFERDSEILSGPLVDAVANQLAIARSAVAARLIEELDERLTGHDGTLCNRLRRAIRALDPNEYRLAREALTALARKEDTWRRRRELLGRLERAAPHWARDIRNRSAAHGQRTLPGGGDAAAAWRWRQLEQEITRRAALDETVLARRLSQQQTALRETTAELIDRLAWLGQLRRTSLHAKQALQGWADTVRKIGRGTGRRAPMLRVEARRLLKDARDAVPVWIMPLSRAAESFDATQRKFDVVILDESSQCDVMGLLAWYLGDSVAVVGDHEQVSPLAVGQNLDTVADLIGQHLEGIPNSHLYDGRASVYDLARQSFGGTIALREHFRCVPDIIGFSNELSYNFEIRPLRAPNSAPQPQVVEYVVTGPGATGRSGKTNLAEARLIAALLKAATEMDEYRGKTIGAISLLGDEQATLLQDLAVSLVAAVELDRRRFLAGNSAQFQGDERDVIFLSMVDTATGATLAMRRSDAFKQRFNVAASRARDQMWLVHSLDPGRDLQSGDLRRRLIEYVRDPGARHRARQRVIQRAESPFEEAVGERLVAAGYQVRSQVVIGNYRIDMVVFDGAGEVAVECDGDRFHGPDQIPADMARQAILERVGWRFVRIRGTRFYRDPQTTMSWVFRELSRLGVQPSSAEPRHDASAAAGEFKRRVVRRALEILREQGWN